MGFPSPAQDFLEPVLTPSYICDINNNSLIIRTTTGYAVIQRGGKPAQGDTALINVDGITQFAKLRGQALICEDGEAIEGDALDCVDVVGVLTFEITERCRDRREGNNPYLGRMQASW